MDDITQQIMNDVHKLEQNNTTVSTVRQRIIDKLALSFDEMPLTGNEKAADLEAKMALTNTLLKALTDSEKQCIDIVKIRQRMGAEKAEKDNAALVSATIAEFIKKVGPGTKILETEISPPINVDHEIDKVVEQENFEIPPGELEFGVSERIRDAEMDVD